MGANWEPPDAFNRTQRLPTALTCAHTTCRSHVSAGHGIFLSYVDAVVLEGRLDSVSRQKREDASSKVEPWLNYEASAIFSW